MTTFIMEEGNTPEEEVVKSEPTEGESTPESEEEKTEETPASE